MLDVRLCRRAYWGLSQSGRMRCPECGMVVVEFLEKDCSSVNYICTSDCCEWKKHVDLSEGIVDGNRQSKNTRR